MDELPKGRVNTSNRIQKITKKASRVYSRGGLKGLYNALSCKFIDACLPTIYKHQVLQSMHHPKLLTVFLELTNNCNLRCKMCNWQSRENRGYISPELFKNCIDQLSEIGINVLNLQFGGESLLHPNFREFLEYAVRKRNLGRIGIVGWTTNGMLFDESIADLVVSLEVDWINFSLDGLGEKNDEIRLGSKYSTIEKNIKYLLKKRGNHKKPTVLINIVDYGKTEEEKLQFFKEWVFLVDEIELLPSISSDNSWENKDQLSEELDLANPPPHCRYPLDTAIIGWDGRVTGCCFDTQMTVVLGDLNQDSLKNIWRGIKFQRLRKSVILNEFSPESPCFKCEYWKVNFKPKDVPILDGKAKIEYGSMTRKIRRTS